MLVPPQVVKVPKETIDSISRAIYGAASEDTAYVVQIFSAEWALQPGNLDTNLDRPYGEFVSHLIVPE